ncbi:MAG: hypothetical protein NVS3B28_16680 [Candidatus Velthaea sp.]
MIARSMLALGLMCALAGSASAASGATTAIDLGPVKFYAQADDSSLLAGVQMFVRAGIDRQTATQNGLAALSAESIVQTPLNGVPLREVIAAHGGSLGYVVGVQDVRFYIEASPEELPVLARLVAGVMGAHDTPAAAVNAARRALSARIGDEERNPISVGLAMVRQSYYTGSAGAPLFGSAASLANLTAGDVNAFVTAHYRRGNAIVTAAGRVTDDVRTAAKTLAAALPEGMEPLSVPTVRAFPATPKRIVTQRDIGVPYVVLGFAAPALGDRDFGAMLVLRSLLSSAFDRASAVTLPAYSRAVGVIYNYDTNPASLALYINGAQLDPTIGLRSVDTTLHAIAATPLQAQLLQRYKASARGEWSTESVSLADRAWLIGTFAEHGISPDYAQTALGAIDAATGTDVQRVAKAYLQRFTVALVLPRSAKT